MFRATVELDFFGMDQHHREAASYSCKSQFQKFPHRPRSFRVIRTVMSKINPEVFKSIIASGNASPNIPNPRKSFSNSKNLSYKLSLNRFVDLSNEEYWNTYLGIKTHAQKKRLSNRNTKSDQYALRVGDSLPDSID
ncbi:hypothetical protein ACFX15_002475 [Malus domestica]